MHANAGDLETSVSLVFNMCPLTSQTWALWGYTSEAIAPQSCFLGNRFLVPNDEQVGHKDLCRICSFLFLNWTYWGDIGSQSHTGFKCTTQQNIIYTLHWAPVARSKVPFHPLLSSLCPPPPTLPPPFPLAITTLLSVSTGYTYMSRMLFSQPLYLLSSSPPTLLHSDSYQFVLCIHASVSILFVSLCCSLDPTYKWDHMVFVFLWLADFT